MIQTRPHGVAALRLGATRFSASPEETAGLAAQILGDFPTCCALALHGELGAGKTCFVQGLARSLGITETVTSPTFTIMREYTGLPGTVPKALVLGRRRLIHVDLYRIRSPDELLAIGFEEWFAGNTLVAIEWAERAGDLLPGDALHLRFSVANGPDRRQIDIS